MLPGIKRQLVKENGTEMREGAEERDRKSSGLRVSITGEAASGGRQQSTLRDAGEGGR